MKINNLYKILTGESDSTKKYIKSVVNNLNDMFREYISLKSPQLAYAANSSQGVAKLESSQFLVPLVLYNKSSVKKGRRKKAGTPKSKMGSRKKGELESKAKKLFRKYDIPNVQRFVKGERSPIAYGKME